MKVPHGSEILDVAAGSGILSCLLQSKGYYNIGRQKIYCRNEKENESNG